MEEIIIRGFDCDKVIIGTCLKSELQWYENVEDFHHLKDGQYATTQTPTQCFTETWETKGKKINLHKYVASIGKWVNVSKHEKVFESIGEHIKYIVAGLDDNEVLDTIEPIQAASAIGKLGGSKKSKAKTMTARENGKKGGRPKKKEGIKNG